MSNPFAPACVLIMLHLAAFAGGCHSAGGPQSQESKEPGAQAIKRVTGSEPFEYPKSQWFPGMLHPPRVKVKLPENFTIVSAGPGEGWGMYDGVIWAPPVTAKRFEHLKERNMLSIAEPMFWVHLSSSAGQIPGTDKFLKEEDMDKSAAEVGMKNMSKRRAHWGSYPVLAITGERPDQTTFFMALVGINSPDGWALLIDYRVPKGEGHPTPQELSIWNQLIDETVAEK